MNPNDAARMKQIEQFDARGGPMDFKQLVALAGLERDRDLRFANWSDVSFAGQNLSADGDLAGLDFTGALLKGCDFRNAAIRGARFDQAVMGNHGEDPGNQTELAWARDWLEHCDEWSRAKDLSSDRHVDEFECFQDAPFAPKLTLLPMGSVSAADLVWGRSVRLSRRIAVATMPVSALHLLPYCRRLSRTHESLPAFAANLDKWHEELSQENGVLNLGREIVPMTAGESDRYVQWLSNETGRTYHCVAEPIWEFAVHHHIIAQTPGLWFEWMRDNWFEGAAGESDGAPYSSGDPNLRVARDFGKRLSAMTRSKIDIREPRVAKLRVERAWVR